jgi:hypothetical protein
MLLERPTTGDNYLADSSFDVAPFLFVSTRLARKYPQSLESKIIRDFKTTVPNRSYQRDKKSSMNVYRSRLRFTAAMNSINLIFLYFIGLIMSLPTSSVERSFYDVLSWVAVGFSVLFQSLLFADNPLVAFCVYASFMCALGTFIYYYNRSARRLKSKNSAGVISIKAILQKQKKKENMEVQVEQSSPEESIMRNVVATLQARNKLDSKYNPRYSKIMESLKNTSALQKCEEEKLSDEDKARSSTSPLVVTTTTLRNVETVDVNNDQDEIRFMSCDNDSSSADDGAEWTVRSTPVGPLQRKRVTEKTSRLNKIVYSHKADLRRISRRRKEMSDFNKKLKEELSLDSDMSDCSNDSYSDDELDDSFEFSSDSSGNKDDVTSGLNYHKVEIQRQTVEVFTKPLSVKTLASRIRRNRDKIHRLSLQRRVRDIEEEFEMSTRARRASILAHQTRAQTKLQRRREHRKSTSKKRKSDAEVDVDPSEVVGANNSELKKLDSFELFNEKKAIVKSFAAHDSKRKQTLIDQQAEAKALLQRRVMKRNVEKE